MEVRVLGAHNLESKGTRHTCFLIDGVLTLDAGSLMGALSPAQQSHVRALLLTHRHFDHTRDLPSLALATLDDARTLEVFSLPETWEGVRAHLMDGALYPDFTQGLNGGPPKYRFRPLEPGVQASVLGYQVMPLPVPHSVASVGYIVRSGSGGAIAYTGDAGGGLLPFLQDPLAPQVLFVDVTFPNWLEARAVLTGHLTPRLLRLELLDAVRKGVALPRIVPVHLSLPHREEVVRELAAVEAELEIDLTPAHEDMVLVLTP
jgi:glyoxylase-like metal-dependent hydrolase (beta-lactamase superfamily II)